MSNPVFFTENQAGVNPHDQLTDLESAQIIISHVTEGLKMAEKANLPGIIKDFISTHHGTGLTKYFYINYCNAHPDENVNKELFQYPGPNPFTREQAILMMATRWKPPPARSTNIPRKASARSSTSSSTVRWQKVSSRNVLSPSATSPWPKWCSQSV